MAHDTLRFGLLTVVAGLTFAGAPALAQSQDAIAYCRSLPTDSERIACLEGALLGARSPAAADPAPTTPAAIAASPSLASGPMTDAQRAAAAEAAGAPVAPAAAASDAMPERRGGFRIPFIGGGRDRGAATQTASSEPAEGLGAEQVRRRMGDRSDDSPQMLAAAVVSSREIPHKRLEVELDNGQVWRQIESDDPWDSLRNDDPVNVEIRASRFGGYRMRIVEQDRTLKVERIR